MAANERIAIINLPKGRKLIIDSKNLMESYIALACTESEAQKAALAANHSRLLKAHIGALSAQEYWRRYDGLDCVILFIPHDGMYHAAIQDEAEVIREACEKRVFISNPMSLIPLRELSARMRRVAAVPEITHIFSGNRSGQNAASKSGRYEAGELLEPAAG